MFHQRRQHTIYFAERLERPTKSCRAFQFQRQVQSYGKNGKRLKSARRKLKNTRNFTKKRNNDMKRHCKDIKKIKQMKWRLLNFTKIATKRAGRFYSLKHCPNQMNLKKYKSPSMIEARKNGSLKKPTEKRPLQRKGKKLKRPYSLKKHQSPQSLLIQTQMTRAINKNLP